MVDPQVLLNDGPSWEVVKLARSLELLDPEDRPWLGHGDNYVQSLPSMTMMEALCSCWQLVPPDDQVPITKMYPVQLNGVEIYYIGQCSRCQTIHYLRSILV